jgi:signal peptidase I
MLPSIWPGDLLTIEKRNTSDLSVGDIVLISQPDRFVIHRVVRIDRTHNTLRFVTKGDSVPQPDRPVNEKELLGTVMLIQREHGAFLPSPRRSLLNHLMAMVMGRSATVLNGVLWLRRVFVRHTGPNVAVLREDRA